MVAVTGCLADFPEEKLYRLLASAELRSEHPLGKAIVSCYSESCKKTVPQPEQFQMLPGRGVSAQTEGVHILAGNPELFAEYQITIPDKLLSQAKTTGTEAVRLLMWQ